MFEFLSKFEKRMEWVGVANSIINRKGKNTEIEGIFSDNDMTNIIISTLLFIMEKSLEENNECDMYQIGIFLDELISTYYNLDLNKEKIKDIANYIIKDILQNNGIKNIYNTKDYDKNTVEEIRIRLIADKIVDEGSSRRIVYMLTNQGFDFLFRTREVDEEIKLTIEQLKLKEYVKRKKFNSAVRQSVELINLVRQKKKEIEGFIFSIRQNIHNVEVEKYEELINSTYQMLSGEYEIMNEIDSLVTQAEQKIKDEFSENKNLDDKILQAKLDLHDIHHNIGIVITEQRDLITNRYNLTELFMETIEKSFEYSFEKRYDIEEIILKRLEDYSFKTWNLFNIIRPLLLPNRSKHLSILSIYEPQMILKETEITDSLFVEINEFDDTLERERIENINNGYIEVIRTIIQGTINNNQIIKLSTLLKYLKSNNINSYNKITEDRRIFKTSLRLYDIGDIKIKDFYNSKEKIIMTPTEEFNLEYCLVKLENMACIKDIIEFQIEKLPDEIEETIIFEDEGLYIKETIRISDILFRVVI